MLYRRAGIRHTTYRHERQLWPLPFDRYLVGAVALFMLAAPFLLDRLYVVAYLLPWIIWSVAALGLNLLMGGAGQIHLGYGAVMAIGAYSCVHLVRAGVKMQEAEDAVAPAVAPAMAREGLLERHRGIGRVAHVYRRAVDQHRQALIVGRLAVIGEQEDLGIGWHALPLPLLCERSQKPAEATFASRSRSARLRATSLRKWSRSAPRSCERFSAE